MAWLPRVLPFGPWHAIFWRAHWGAFRHVTIGLMAAGPAFCTLAFVLANVLDAPSLEGRFAEAFMAFLGMVATTSLLGLAVLEVVAVWVWLRPWHGHALARATEEGIELDGAVVPWGRVHNERLPGMHVVLMPSRIGFRAVFLARTS